jgi:protein CpxP
MFGSSSTTSTRAVIVLSRFVHGSFTSFPTNQGRRSVTMTTTRKRIALAAAAAALTIGVSAGVHAVAQDPNTNQNTNSDPRSFKRGPGRGPGRFGGPGGGMGLLPMLPRQLQLTDAQRDQVRTIAQSHADEWKALAERARTARQALMAAVTGDSIDETLIRAKSAEVAAVEADLNVARARAGAEVRQILTPEQKTKLKELQSRRAERSGQARPGPSGPRGRR